MQEIKRFSEYVMHLFDWSVIPLGSPLRTHAYSYRNWGILLTMENAAGLMAASKDAYGPESSPTGESLNHLLTLAAKNACLLDTNLLMNQEIGTCAPVFLPDLKHDVDVVVINIGTGTGGTILEILRSMSDEYGVLSNLRVFLIDPSETRLDFAISEIDKLLEEKKVRGKPKIQTFVGSVDVLEKFNTNLADMIVQCAAIHHESFNSHLAQIHRVLKLGKRFLSGDWHEGNYETPARVYWIYDMLQNPDNEDRVKDIFNFALRKLKCCTPDTRMSGLHEFRRLYSLDDDYLNMAYEGLTGSERAANVGAMKYWLEVAKAVAKEGKKSPECLLQAHERVLPRMKALIDAGFVFDHESQRRYTEVLKSRGFGELGTFMAPLKPPLRYPRVVR